MSPPPNEDNQHNKPWTATDDKVLTPVYSKLVNAKKSKNAKKKRQTSQEDRQRTWAGKTVNSKVRSEGRAAAALERRSITKRIYLAEHGEN